MQLQFEEIPIIDKNYYTARGFSRVYSTLKTADIRQQIEDKTDLYEQAYQDMMTPEAYLSGTDEYEYAEDIGATRPRGTLFNEAKDAPLEEQKYDFESRSLAVPNEFLDFLTNTTVPERYVASGLHYSPQAIRTFMQILLNPGIYTNVRMNNINEEYIFKEFQYFAATYLYNCNLITGSDANLIADGNPSFLTNLLHSPEGLYANSEDSLYNPRARVYQDYIELAADLELLRSAYTDTKVFLIHGKFNIIPPHLGYLGILQYLTETFWKYKTSDEKAIFIIGCDSNQTIETFGGVPIWNTFARMSFLVQHPSVDFIFKTPDFLTKLATYKGWANIYKDLGVNYVNIEDGTPLTFKQVAQARWAGAKRISLVRSVIYPVDPYVGEDDIEATQKYLRMSEVEVRSSRIKSNMVELSPLAKVAIATVHQLNERTKVRKVNWNQRLNGLR
jgi:hypothetical protein